jgi:hypothetical protein
MKKSTALAMAIAALTGAASAQDVAKEIESVKATAAAAKTEAASAKSAAAAVDTKVAATDAKLDATSEKLDATKGKLDGLEESYLETKSTVESLAKIKVSGLMQARVEIGMDTGVIDAKNAPLNAQFKVRRGRVKVAHEGKLGDFAIQLQYAEDGLKLMDAYGSFYDPWKFVKARVGVQDIPYGFEIGYSSASMETMERSLVEQTVFNGEKDLGAVFSLNYSEDFFKYIDLKAGVMNGNMNVVGLPIVGSVQNGASQAEFDNGKAYIGRLGFKAPVKDYNFEIDGGVSEYFATYTSVSDKVYDFAGKLDNTNATSHLSIGNLRADLNKQIFGGDLQAYVNVLPFGGTVIRGEFYTGNNVCLNNNKVFDPYTYGVNASKTDSVVNSAGKKVAVVTAISDTKTNDAYIKPVMGWYGTLIQNIGNDFQVVGRYEQFDPNTKVEGDAIGVKGSNTSKDDLGYTQISVGVNYFLSGNVKLSVAYDHKVNETSATLKNATDARSDYSSEINNDKTTLQLQYKF